MLHERFSIFSAHGNVFLAAKNSSTLVGKTMEESETRACEMLRMIYSANNIRNPSYVCESTIYLKQNYLSIFFYVQ